MRHAQRLTAPKGHVGNALGNEALRDLECRIALQLIIPSVSGTGFLAAGKAMRTAEVGQLPGDKQRCVVILDRAPDPTERYGDLSGRCGDFR